MESYEERRAARLAALAPRIARQTLSIAAVHHVPVTADDVSANLAANPHWTSLSLGYLLDITERLYLIDVSTTDLGLVDAQLDDVTQDNGHGQAPWGERFFDATGFQTIEGSDHRGCPPEDFASPGRVRFFMHYFDPGYELLFGDVPLIVPPPTPLPGWLAELMPYEPPN